MSNNINTNNEPMPEVMTVVCAQDALKHVFQSYNLPIYVWQLILKDFMNEVNMIYNSQLMTVQEEYLKKNQEKESHKESEVNQEDSRNNKEYPEE